MKYYVSIIILTIILSLFLFWSYDTGLEKVKSMIMYTYLQMSQTIKNELESNLSLQTNIEDGLYDLLYRLGSVSINYGETQNGAIFDDRGNPLFISSRYINTTIMKQIIKDMKDNDADELFFNIEDNLWGYVAYYADKKRYFFTTYKYPFPWVSEDKGIVVDFIRKYKNNYTLYAVYQDTLGIISSSVPIKELDNISDDPIFLSVLQKMEIKYREEKYEGQDIFEVIIPVDSISLIRIAYSMEPYKEYEKSIYRLYLIGLIISIILVAIGILAIIFIIKWKKLYISMKERESQERVFNEIKNMASWTAHEIRNPLNSINIGIQRLKEETTNKESIIEIIEKEIKRLSAIVDDFLIMVKSGQKGQTISLNEIVIDAINSLSMELNEKKVMIKKDIDSQYFLPLEKKAGVSIFVNLIKNAMEANAKTINIYTDKNFIYVCNDGDPIDSGIKDRIFQQYATSKPKGNGIGLAMIKTVLMENNMDIDLITNKGEVCFIIRAKKREH